MMANKMKHVGWVVAVITNCFGEKYENPILYWRSISPRRRDAIDRYETETYGMKKNYKKNSRKKSERVKAVKLFVEVGE